MGTSTSFCRQHALCLRQSPGGPPLSLSCGSSLCGQEEKWRLKMMVTATPRTAKSPPATTSTPGPTHPPTRTTKLLLRLPSRVASAFFQNCETTFVQQQPPNKKLKRYHREGTHHYHCHDDTTPSSASAVGPMLPRGSQLQPWPSEINNHVLLYLRRKIEHFVQCVVIHTYGCKCN